MDFKVIFVNYVVFMFLIWKNRWFFDLLSNYEDERDSLNKNIRVLWKMLYVRISKKSDKLIEKYKNLWLIRGFSEVLRLYKMIFEKF